LPAVERLLARHGVTSYFPTTVTAPVEVTLRALERLAAAIETPEGSFRDRARPLGIHLEGPFLSHVRRGVHPVEQLQKPTAALFDRFWEAARGKITIMTIAPELEGAEEVIAEAARQGVCVSLGHSDADFETAQKAFRAGGRHATHTFNAMRPLGHRDPGLLGAVLTEPACTADIIADGIHVDPAVVRLFLTAKGRENSVLITDATAATGMPDGRYRLGSFEVEVRDGRCMAEGKLAGSVLTMDRAVRNAMQFAGWGLAAAVQAASANPARVIGLKDRGVLCPGAVADFVVLDSAGNLRQTIVNGQVA
jgi:N-acetylglucosamine-6-phosphate deacetylase